MEVQCNYFCYFSKYAFLKCSEVVICFLLVYRSSPTRFIREVLIVIHTLKPQKVGQRIDTRKLFGIVLSCSETQFQMHIFMLPHTQMENSLWHTNFLLPNMITNPDLDWPRLDISIMSEPNQIPPNRFSQPLVHLRESISSSKGKSQVGEL